jgi:hypothetical protein
MSQIWADGALERGLFEALISAESLDVGNKYAQHLFYKVSAQPITADFFDGRGPAPFSTTVIHAPCPTNSSLDMSWLLLPP